MKECSVRKDVFFYMSDMNLTCNNFQLFDGLNLEAHR